MVKICFGMIVFNSDFVLNEVLQSIYPFAEQIVITHGPVAYWQHARIVRDDTAKILKEFPDPDKKITIVTAAGKEKTELCRAYMPFIWEDITHLWTIDADEVFKPEDIEKVITILETQDPHSISFRSNSFFGGFDSVLNGFEREHDFKRVLKYHKDCEFVDHRPPTLSTENVTNPLHIRGEEMMLKHDVMMYHYSYTFPRQVREKVQYYEAAVISAGKCIPHYFEDVYLRWVMGGNEQRKEVERQFKGVHEFIPAYRGDCYPVKFEGEHPDIIKAAMPKLLLKFNSQLQEHYSNIF